MKLRTMRALLALTIVLAGCAQGSQTGSGDITTGSILPSAASLLPSTSALLPGVSSPTRSRPAERVSGNLYRVEPDRRRIDDAVQRENFALLRAAEAARWAGGTHFIVVNATSQTSPGGSGTPGTLIRVLRLEAGAEAPIGAVAADEIIHFFGPSFGRSPAEGTPPAASQQG